MALQFRISEDTPQFRLERIYRDFASQCREANPLPSPETFDDLERSQYEIIKAIIARQRNFYISRRKTVHSWQVFESTMPGLVAFVEATERQSENTILLTCKESEKVWKLIETEHLMNEPHSNHFLYFDALNRGEEDYRRDYAYLGGQLLCLRGGYVAGPLCGSGSDSIWHWDGIELKRVDDGTMWVS